MFLNKTTLLQGKRDLIIAKTASQTVMNVAGGGADQRWEGIFAIAVGTKLRREENVWRFSPLGFNPPDRVVLFGNNEGYCGLLDPLINVLSASQQNPHTILTEDLDPIHASVCVLMCIICVRL